MGFRWNRLGRQLGVVCISCSLPEIFRRLMKENKERRKVGNTTFSRREAARGDCEMGVVSLSYFPAFLIPIHIPKARHEFGRGKRGVEIGACNRFKTTRHPFAGGLRFLASATNIVP